MALANTIAKMLRHEHTIVHDEGGVGETHVSYNLNTRAPSRRYFLLELDRGVPVRYYSDPRRAAADFIHTVCARNASAAAREAQADARTWTQHRKIRDRSMRS